MRVVINKAQINRKRKISHTLFFISLGGMGLGFFYTWTADPSSSASQVTCFILPILMLLTLSSVRMANIWIREPRPEDALTNGLKGLGQKYTIFHHLLPAPHVLVGPEGVFTITVVWQDKSYRISGKKWHGDEGLLRKLNGYLRQDLIGNPFNDATLHAQKVQRLINKIDPDSGVEVQPLVVFINPQAQFEAEDPLYPVLYADPKKKPSLRQYLREQKASPRTTLQLEHLDVIDEMYGLLTRQEIAELSGDSLAHEEGSHLSTGDVLEPDFAGGSSETETGDHPERGTVFIAQAGQLYYIGATDRSVEEAIAELRESSEQAINIVHTFETADPQSVCDALRHKFSRKRQKEIWFGLSKKDIAWLKSRKDAN